MNTLIVLLITENLTFGQIAGVALVLFVMFFGTSVLVNGWPEFRKKK